ncbi:metal-dependent hydrolase family protein [Pseudonocardia sp. HH130630-07]|uniref:metal-dependent hydrolase family protein n=1 Tax=Pseudonocardia sp. HH130630-07 TaxID=1690815 RepID=UPI0008153084|nr:amidohydrolase family protein [Pseudonocardia sp. HH130630-07]ANY05447.1 peptidase M38 [Pseudonocardia sp. HH130630-07]
MDRDQLDGTGRARWLTGATVVDGTGADPVADRSVVVADGRIVALGGRPPAGADVLDLTGLVLTPGLIDAHVHLGLSSDLDRMMAHRIPVAELAADVFENCRRTLESGFTTVRDTGGLDRGVAQVVADGRVPGPRILQCGPALAQTGGHGYLGAVWEDPAHWPSHHVPGLTALSLVADGPDEVRRTAREVFRRGADFLKMCVTGGVVSHFDELSDTQFTFSEIAAAVAEASARGTYVTVHAHNTAGLRTAIDAGVRCVEHGSGIDEGTAALMAARGVAHVPTLAVAERLLTGAAAAGLPAHVGDRVAGILEAQGEAVLASRAAGVLVGSGSDYTGPDQDRRGRELLLRSRIESPMAALLSATRDNARILGIADDAGTVEPGKVADLTVFAADPLADPEVFDRPGEVVVVLRAGRVVKDTR